MGLPLMIHELAEQFGISEEAALRVQAAHRCSWRAPFPATNVSRSGRTRCKIAPAPARTPKKEEHKEIAEKGCYYRATTNSTSETSSVSRRRNCSSGCFVGWDVDGRGCGGKNPMPPREWVVAPSLPNNLSPLRSTKQRNPIPRGGFLES